MRRAMPGIAVIAAGLLLTAGCTSSGAWMGGSAPSTDGIGPITFAIGKDNPGWLQGVITGWNQRNPSFPPVWTQLYTDKNLISSYHYSPVLEQAINSAQPRPAIANYDQASLAISSTVYEVLAHQKEPQQALTEMAGQLTQIIRDG